jgi:hypothetical protein
MALDEKLPLVLFGSEAAAVGAAVKDARVRLRAAAAAAALEKQRLARKTGAVPMASSATNGSTTNKNGSTAPASVTDAEVSFFSYQVLALCCCFNAINIYNMYDTALMRAITCNK